MDLVARRERRKLLSYEGDVLKRERRSKAWRVRARHVALFIGSNVLLWLVLFAILYAAPGGSYLVTLVLVAGNLIWWGVGRS